MPPAPADIDKKVGRDLASLLSMTVHVTLAMEERILKEFGEWKPDCKMCIRDRVSEGGLYCCGGSSGLLQGQKAFRKGFVTGKSGGNGGAGNIPVCLLTIP